MPRTKSKTPFTIYSDVTGLHTPDSIHADTFDDAIRAANTKFDNAVARANASIYTSPRHGIDNPIPSIETDDYVTESDSDAAANYTYDRRTSALTSISSLPPSSNGYSDAENGDGHLGHGYTSPTKNRPMFRTPSSVRRMQMSSPEPSLLGSSHRGSIRSATPRRNAQVRASPRPRTKERQQEKEETFALVLLHVTLLPVSLPWSAKNMAEVLPAGILEGVDKLKKTSEMVVRRGVLIEHPREEFEVLEERLLEALELRRERLGKCGHFFGGVDEDEEGSDADELLGGGDDDRCGTCRCAIKDSRNGVGGDDCRWDIKVYASNGLMRAGAWAAAWQEMERVDVEILPWVPDEYRKVLDDLKAKEEEEERQARYEYVFERPQSGMRHSNEHVPREDLQLEYKSSEPVRESDEAPQQMMIAPPLTEPETQTQPSASPAKPRQHPMDLPQVYRPKDIPLDILIRNYIYLLLKDRRNMIIVVLAVIAIWLSVNATTSATAKGLVFADSSLNSPVVARSTPAEATGVDGTLQMAGVPHLATLQAPTNNEDASHEESRTSEEPSVWFTEDIPVHVTTTFTDDSMAEKVIVEEPMAEEAPPTEPESAQMLDSSQLDAGSLMSNADGDSTFEDEASDVAAGDVGMEIPETTASSEETVASMHETPESTASNQETTEFAMLADDAEENIDI